MSFRDVVRTPGVPAVLFTQFMVAFGFGVILPILPFYTLSLGAKPFELGLLTSTFALMGLVFNPIFGKWSDQVGRKKVVLLGVGGFFLAYLLFAFSTTLWMAFLARAVEGMAAGAVFPSCISLLSDLTSEKQRGVAMSLFTMMFSMGFMLGPAVGGIAAAVSVQTAFFVAVVLTVLNFASVFFQLQEPHEKAESRDLQAQELTLLQRLRSPLLFLFLSVFMIAFMVGGIDATLALYTADKMGFTSAQVGVVFAYIGLMIFSTQFLAGGLVNRFGELRLIRAGLVLSGLGFFLLQFSSDWAHLFLALTVFVAGNALVFPSVNSLLTKKVTARRGAVLGLSGSFNSLGQIMGPLLAGVLYSLHPVWAFWGQAAVIWAYFIVFSLVAVPALTKPASAASR